MQEMSETRDAQLMQRIAGQDRGAFERLLDLHLTGVRSYLQRLSSDPSTAEDLAQETFLKVWLNAQQYQASTGALSTWLYRIAHNQFLDHVKSSGQKLEQATSAAQDVAELSSAAPIANIAKISVSKRPSTKENASRDQNGTGIIRIKFGD